MAENKQPKVAEVPPPTSMAPARREQKITKMSARIEAMERAIDIILSDHEEMFNSYVAYFRLRYGCDPDTSTVPADYLDQALAGEGPDE